MAPNRHTELNSLLCPTFAGFKDDFGKDIDETIPLSSDRINEGRSSSSDFLLARLPIEIVWYIIQLVPQESLGNLAFVNRDCRQLARSRQFASVTFDYSDCAIELLDTLLKERVERAENYGKTRLASLGACVRRITVATSPVWVELRHGIRLEEVQIDRLDQACRAVFDEYYPSICLVLSSTAVLPHLKSLTWRDSASIGKDVFEVLFSLNLRHLGLHRVHVNQEFALDLPSRHLLSGLDSLYLDLSWTTNMVPKENTISPLIYSLICLGAPTLESLVFACLRSRAGPYTVQIPSSVSDHPRFPKLRDLHLGKHMDYDPAWLKILIPSDGPSSIRSLEVDIARTPVIEEFFSMRGNLQFLEVFVWSGYFMNGDPLDFLEANSHIRKLKIDDADAHAIEDQLLPLLCAKFKNLASLSLRWPENCVDIPQKALAQIATLHQLEQLCLSAGVSSGWQYTWYINHDAMQNCVSNLPNLRKLAFPRDTYGASVSEHQQGSELVNYYEKRHIRTWNTLPSYAELLAAGGNFATVRRLLWEEQHQLDMISIAMEYVTLVPKLEWIYLGQYPIRLTRCPNGDATAVPLSTERDDCWTYLRRMFGRKNDMT